MTLRDGISRRLGSKPGKPSVLVILKNFHRLVFCEVWREKEQKYHFPESNQRTREYKTGMLTTTQGSWVASCLWK
jgi:hypothetical protein